LDRGPCPLNNRGPFLQWGSLPFSLKFSGVPSHVAYPPGVTVHFFDFALSENGSSSPIDSFEDFFFFQRVIAVLPWSCLFLFGCRFPFPPPFSFSRIYETPDSSLAPTWPLFFSFPFGAVQFKISSPFFPGMRGNLSPPSYDVGPNRPVGCLPPFFPSCSRDFVSHVYKSFFSPQVAACSWEGPPPLALCPPCHEVKDLPDVQRGTPPGPLSTATSPKSPQIPLSNLVQYPPLWPF